LLLLPLAACTQADEPFHDGNEGAYESCEETVTVLESVDEASTLGFSAGDVLAFAEGSHQSSIHWHPGEIDFGPETGEGELSVEVEYDGGEIRYVDSEPKNEEGFGGDCPDRLEIDANVTMKTSGGALDEHFVGTIQAMRSNVATILQKREPGDFEGALTIEDIETENGEATAITLGIGLSTFGIFGSIDGGIQVEDGDAVGFGGFNYATFPDAKLACEFPFEAPVPFDAAFGGFSAADALALLATHPEHVLTWDGDEPTPLTLTAVHDGAPICARMSPTTESEGDTPISFGVEVTMLSDDGRLDGTLDLTARAMADASGELTELYLTHEAPYAEHVSPEDFEATYGIHGVDLSGYDGGGLTFDASVTPEYSTGAITVLGAVVHQCSDEPGEPCEGTDMQEIEGGTWHASE
jgi:hypothetical protein